MVTHIIFYSYNEELVIDESYRRIKEVIGFTKEKCEIVFVNDGN